MGRTADFFSRRHFRKSKFVLMSKASVKKEVKSSSHSGGHSREKPVSRAPSFLLDSPGACFRGSLSGPWGLSQPVLPDRCWQDSAQGRRSWSASPAPVEASLLLLLAQPLEGIVSGASRGAL